MVIPGGSFPHEYNMGTLQSGPRVMFTLIVHQLLLAGVPFKRIHTLCFLFTSPKIPHFHHSRALLFDGIIGNPDGSYVVAVDGGFGLWVAEVFECESKNHSFLAIYE